MNSIGLSLVYFVVGQELAHPARIQVDEVAGRAAMVCEMLDREAWPMRPGRAYRQPVPAPREGGLVECLGRRLVVMLEVVPSDALLGRPGGSAGLEDHERTTFEGAWNEAFVGL